MTSIATDLLKHIDFDLGMNRESGYVPAEGVIATRAMRAAEERISTMLCAVHMNTTMERAPERKGHVFQVMVTDLIGEAYRIKQAELFAFLKKNGEALGISVVRLEVAQGRSGLFITMDSGIYMTARICAPLYLAALAKRGAKIPGMNIGEGA